MRPLANSVSIAVWCRISLISCYCLHTFDWPQVGTDPREFIFNEVKGKGIGDLQGLFSASSLQSSTTEDF